MLRHSLRVRLLLPVLALVVAAVALATLALARTEADRVKAEAAASIQRQSTMLQSLFSATRSIMFDRVHDAMRLLRQEGESIGPPAIGAAIAVPGRRAPVADLLLGGTPVGNTFALVDRVSRTMHGTASIFSRSDGEFVRISTNVEDVDGRRAVGTVLDPHGPVIGQILKNRSFYGVVDILGHLYVAGYEPILNGQGTRTIGIWHVGYEADLGALDRVIGDSRVLHAGFVALFDNTGRLRFRSMTGTTTDPAMMTRIASTRPADWVVSRQPVPGWGLTLVSAYPESDVENVILRRSVWIGGAGLLLGIVLLGLQSALIWSCVLKPVQHLTEVADELSMGKWNHTIEEVELKDEIGALARAIARLSNTVRLAMERLRKR